MNTEGITEWELAVCISEKLNQIIDRKEMIRNGRLVSGLRPQDILEKRPDRMELEFYYERICEHGK